MNLILRKQKKIKNLKNLKNLNQTQYLILLKKLKKNTIILMKITEFHLKKSLKKQDLLKKKLGKI